MNRINLNSLNRRMTKGFVLLLSFLSYSFAASADAKISIEDLEIGVGETKEVALLLDNDEAATAMQVTLDLPAGLSYVNGSATKTSRINGRGATVQASTQTGKLIIVETGGTIAAGQGAVITFQVRRAAGLTDRDYEVPITDITISDAAATQLNSEETAVWNVKAIGLTNCIFAATEEAFEISEGDEYQIDITLSNENIPNLAALEGRLTLPEGLEIVPGDEGDFIYSDRTPSPLEFKFQQFEGYKSFILSSTNNTCITGTSGVIFSFKVKAAEGLAKNTEIVLSDLRVAATTGQSALCPDVTIAVTNATTVKEEANDAAYEALSAEIDALQTALDEAKEGIAEEVAEQFTDTIAAIQQQIDEAKAALDAANEAVELTEESLIEGKENIEAATTQLIENAAAAKEAYDEQVAKQEANDAAYEALNAELTALEDAIEAAKDAIEEDAADVADTYLEQLGELEQQVANAREALEAANEAQELTADSTNGELPTADDIQAVVDAAKEAQDKYLIPGDITGSGEVDFDDLDAFIDNFLDDDLPTDPTDPEFARYDVNGDGRIDVADAQAILNLANGLNIDGSSKNTNEVRNYAYQAVTANLTAHTIQLANGVTRYVISIDGNLRYTGFQMDVEGEIVAENGDNIMSRDNGIRHRIISLASGASGKVLTIDVKGQATFDNICFTTSKAQALYLEIAGQATAINGISAAQQGAQLYSVGGAQLSNAQHGINIVRQADGSVKKVLVK